MMLLANTTELYSIFNPMSLMHLCVIFQLVQQKAFSSTSVWEEKGISVHTQCPNQQSLVNAASLVFAFKSFSSHLNQSVCQDTQRIKNCK